MDFERFYLKIRKLIVKQRAFDREIQFKVKFEKTKTNSEKCRQRLCLKRLGKIIPVLSGVII